MARARGFTLLELLVAMAVLALLASISWRGLDSILGAQAQVQAEMRRWEDVDRVLQQLARDLSLALERPEHAPAGELLITRLGEMEAGAGQSGPRRVGYRLRDGGLEYFTHSSSSAATTVEASRVLENVAALELRALGPDGQWRPLRLEPHQAAGAPPRALAAEIVLAGGERISRIFPLP
jgi:general secretion pathway protein J